MWDVETLDGTDIMAGKNWSVLDSAVAVIPNLRREYFVYLFCKGLQVLCIAMHLRRPRVAAKYAAASGE